MVRRKRDRFHLLLLSIVATRLRSAFGSMEDARLTWLLEGQCLLRRLDNPLMESAILDPTTKTIAQTNIRAIAQDSHILLELIASYM